MLGVLGGVVGSCAQGACLFLFGMQGRRGLRPWRHPSPNTKTRQARGASPPAQAATFFLGCLAYRPTACVRRPAGGVRSESPHVGPAPVRVHRAWRSMGAGPRLRSARSIAGNRNSDATGPSCSGPCCRLRAFHSLNDVFLILWGVITPQKRRPIFGKCMGQKSTTPVVPNQERRTRGGHRLAKSPPTQLRNRCIRAQPIDRWIDQLHRALHHGGRATGGSRARRRAHGLPRTNWSIDRSLPNSTLSEHLRPSAAWKARTFGVVAATPITKH